MQLLGVLYYHDNRLNEAEVAWKEAIGLDTSNIDTRSNYVSTQKKRKCVNTIDCSSKNRKFKELLIETVETNSTTNKQKSTLKKGRKYSSGK